MALTPIPKVVANGMPGFVHMSKFKQPNRLMLGIEGLPDTGKTEFSMTAPPGIGILAIDRGYEHVISKKNPPPHRQKDVSFRVFHTPQVGQDPGEGNTYKSIWKEFYDTYRDSLSSSFRTIVIDGDSDTWELQQLAAFGKVTQVPPLQRTDVNAARRVMIARGFDSGKNIIFTYRLKAEYENVVKLNSNGVPVEVSERTGGYRRSGFSDQEYLVQVHLRTLFNPERKNGKYGVIITKCKIDNDLVGMELWGDECNFATLVQYLYPGVSLEEWGL